MTVTYQKLMELAQIAEALGVSTQLDGTYIVICQRGSPMWKLWVWRPYSVSVLWRLIRELGGVRGKRAWRKWDARQFDLGRVWEGPQ
jgi:hypothetical protein